MQKTSYKHKILTFALGFGCTLFSSLSASEKTSITSSTHTTDINQQQPRVSITTTYNNIQTLEQITHDAIEESLRESIVVVAKYKHTEYTVHILIERGAKLSAEQYEKILKAIGKFNNKHKLSIKVACYNVSFAYSDLITPTGVKNLDTSDNSSITTHCNTSNKNTVQDANKDSNCENKKSILQFIKTTYNKLTSKDKNKQNNSSDDSQEKIFVQLGEKVNDPNLSEQDKKEASQKAYNDLNEGFRTGKFLLKSTSQYDSLMNIDPTTLKLLQNNSKKSNK
jgi:hypothetical protein